MKNYLKRIEKKMYKRKFLVLSALLLATSVLGKDLNNKYLPVDNLKPRLYLVVGVFEFHRNATNFTEHLVNSGKDSAQYAFYPPRNLYYVHLGKYDDVPSALKDLKVIRAEEDFEEAWLFDAAPYSLPDEPEVEHSDR